MSDLEHKLYLRRMFVLGAAEWLVGMHGSKENEKLKFGYTDREWEWIWSTMIEDGAWAVPALRDTEGNYLKENFAPELMIKYAAHELKCHIIVFDLQLNRIQFCSGNYLKDENVIFDSPLILYATGGHFQSVSAIDNEYVIQLTNQLELENRHDSVESHVTSEEISKTSNCLMETEMGNKDTETEIDQTEVSNETETPGKSEEEETEWEIRFVVLKNKSKRTLEEKKEYTKLRLRKKRQDQSEAIRQSVRQKDCERKRKNRENQTEEVREMSKRKDLENKSRKKIDKKNKLFKIGTEVDIAEFHENTNSDFCYVNQTNLFEQQTCDYCHALKWTHETPSFCCNNGKIKLPRIKNPPKEITELMKSKHFIGQIRAYNNALALASIGSDNKFDDGPCFKVQGKLHHLIGSLTPGSGLPKFAQLYFVDTSHELENRLSHMDNLKTDILEALQKCLHEVNPYVKHLKCALEVANNIPDCRLVLTADAKQKPDRAHTRNYNLPNGSEVAVLLPGDHSGDLDVILHTRGDKIQQIKSVHRSYDALHYVLLLPFGEDGFQPGLPLINVKTGHISVMQFYSYHLQVRGKELNMLLMAHRLSQQYITDQYAKIERARLTWINQNQKTIKAEKYKGLLDAFDNGDITAAGKRIILPPSITYSPRWYTERYQDAMAITRKEGKPDLFITFTCNPLWPEIQQSLNSGETAFDRPDICARVFNMKAKNLMIDITENEIFGKTVAHVETIEWQKRGLPHIHILLTLHDDDKLRDPNDIDRFVSAEIPDPVENPKLFEVVKRHMIHGPCGKINTMSPCMKNIGSSTVKACTKEFPKAFVKSTETSESSYPVYRRRSPGDGGRTLDLYKGNKKYVVDNSWVIPYNPVLLLRYDCHINVEAVATVVAVKYLYKYISKGPDRSIIEISKSREKNDGQVIDEVKQFLDCRYLSAAESIWKIYGFSVHGKSHTVIKLSCHLESEQTVLMEEGEELRALLSGEPETTLTAFFKSNCDDVEAKKYIYPDFPNKYTWNNADKKWKKRKLGFAIGRVPTVPFNLKTMELYCLRVLLHHVAGPTSFVDLRTVNGTVFPSFHAACIELGLMDDESELDRALDEAASLKFGDVLRRFFVTLIIYVKPADPNKLWNTHKEQLAADWLRDTNKEKAENKVLLWLRNNLASHDITLKQLGIPEPVEEVKSLPRLIEQELAFDKDKEIDKAINAVEKMNVEQKTFFDAVIKAINNKNGSLFFLDAPGGTGKTFVLNALLSAVRGDGEIALGTAISAVASKLLNRGTTVHSRLKVPIQIKESSVCSFSKNDATGKLLMKTKLLIIDEVSMGHKYVYEAIDKSLRMLFENDDVFGNLVVVFAGDWRQCLPIVPRGSDGQIVDATLKFSYLWKFINVFNLKINMRIQLSNSEEGLEFSKYLLAVGDGSCVGGEMVQIPEDMQIQPNKLEALIDFVFPNLEQNSKNSTWLSERAILCPTNVQAKEVNDLVSSRFPGEERVYKSSDSTDDMNIDFTPEFLNSCDLPGLAPHCLKLKQGTLVMLIRNLDSENGHCNGVKYVVNNLLDRVIEMTSVNGSNPGLKLLVPRILMINNDLTLPFSLRRKQFPIRPAFAMTANKSQGQTLARVGIYLGRDFFSHGQLYVALSRCGNRDQIKILSRVGKKEGFTGIVMRNCVFKEVLSALSD